MVSSSMVALIDAIYVNFEDNYQDTHYLSGWLIIITINYKILPANKKH